LSFFHSPHIPKGEKSVKQNQIAFNGVQRRSAGIGMESQVQVEVVSAESVERVMGIFIQVDLYSKKNEQIASVFEEDMTLEFKKMFSGQIFKRDQQLIMNVTCEDRGKTKSKILRLKILTIATPSGVSQPGELRFGMLEPTSLVHWSVPDSGGQVLLNTTGGDHKSNLFKGEFNFVKLGIGGLDAEFETIFRKAFASRVYSAEKVRAFGIHHVRGMLLYGPPGCGKTLIAREIGKLLNARDPKIVNGPEVLDKYVGSAEEKIRELFADAEVEQLNAGDESMLHIIIFDEIDAICKSRGTVRDGTGVHDSIVNQLLSKIDGVDILNNILIIGMTNRKDMIDDALLRPGRLEVQIEIGLPDEFGRSQILNIHTADMKENGVITEEAINFLPILARSTQNYTGAELAGIIRSATSFALRRNIELNGDEVKTDGE